nr:radical SAM protein [uncultured Methanospirillum sp.]
MKSKKIMTRILLIQPPFQPNHFFKKGFFSAGKQAPLFPFGIGYIASFLKKRGYQVEVLDIYANQFTQGQVIEKINEIDFDFVGISALVTQYEYVKWLSVTIKERKQVPIFVGNGLGTHSDRLVLEKIPSVDICVRGEGEITVYEIIQSWPDLTNIKGITYRGNGGELNINTEREVCQDIDRLPIPAYELFNMELYINTKIYDTGIFNIRSKYINKRILPMLTSRGCPYNCNFCGKVLSGVRLRNISNIVDEIQFLKEKYSIDGIHFIDELVVSNKKRATEISNALKPLNIFWDCQARVNTVDQETLEIMKNSGCVAIGFGIESGSQKILDAMNKKITVEQIKSAMRAAKNVDIDVKVQLIFGYPGESIDTLNDTLLLFKEMKNPGRTFSFICPLPGTKLYKSAIRSGLIDDEEEFIYKITDGFDNNVPIINFTNFEFNELIPLMKKYANDLENNYLLYLLHDPRELVKLVKKFGIIPIKYILVKLIYKEFIKKSNSIS